MHPNVNSKAMAKTFKKVKKFGDEQGWHLEERGIKRFIE
jgi:hypothetical protein